MLEQPDPQTGELLDFENVQKNCVSFLIAGHETTSGMLSFAIALLLGHPNVLNRCRQVADRVLGNERARFEHLAGLSYIEQVLKETLRLHPTVGMFSVSSAEDQMLGNRFFAKKNTLIYLLLDSLHRDPAIWTEPDKFDPDRFSPERRDTIPNHAWMPFGNGPRSCIGRNFTLQEGTLTLA